jgi:hypothetical protein
MLAQKEMSGVESKLVKRKNPNGSMGRIYSCYKNIKNCVSAGIKYDTGSKVVKLIYELTIKFNNERRKFHTVILEQCAEFMDKVKNISGLKLMHTNKDERKELNELAFKIHGWDYTNFQIRIAKGFTLWSLSKNTSEIVCSKPLKIKIAKMAGVLVKKTKGQE